MAIRKVGSRCIFVDGVFYLWRVRQRPTYCQANGWRPLSVSIQRAERPGAVLVVNLDRPRPDNWFDTLASESRPLRPSEVAGLVRHAIAAGWCPERPGPQFFLTTSADG